MRTEKTPKAIQLPADVETYLRDFASRVEWATCPQCKTEWNALTPSGICITCVDHQAEDDRRQVFLGEYLKKTIGNYGIENYSFSRFETNESNELAYQAAIRFNPDKENLYFFGGCGVGKTHLAGAIFKEAAAKNLPTRWVNPMYLARKFKSHWAQDEDALIDDLISTKVFIFDDLGAGRDLELMLRLIYEILDKRQAKKMNGIVITSNLSLDDLAKAYRDDRITSRISGMCRVVKMQGPDRRNVRGTIRGL